MKTRIMVIDLNDKPVKGSKIYFESAADTFRYPMVKDNPNTIVFTVTNDYGIAEVDLNGLWAFVAYGETLRTYPTFIYGGSNLTVVLSMNI